MTDTPITNDAESAPDAAPDADARRRRPRARWIVASAFLLVAAGFGVYAYLTIHSALSSKYQDIRYTIPAAPKLSAKSGEMIYRIDPGSSQVSYGVDEKIVGQSAHHATGLTNGISGDIALNSSHPNLSRVGDIVVNIEELHSDNRLRDGRIRQEFLESHKYPLTVFHTKALVGMPSSIEQGKTYNFTLIGTMTIKGKDQPISWAVQATANDGKLRLSAESKVKMSDLGIGPISLVGLVTTSNDVDLTMTVTAVDPARYTVTTELPQPVSKGGSGKSPSFQKEVLPILSSSCASCHNTGQVGAAHWKLDTAGDAVSIGAGLETVVVSRYMPPWPASHLSVPMVGNKSLTQAQIDTLVKWVRAGSKLDVPATTKVNVAKGPFVPQPRHDVTMRSPVGYAGSLDNENDYRCFIFDPKFTAPTWITGYDVTPDQRQEIHHVQVFHVTAGQVADAEANHDGKDGKPGWPCYGGPGLRYRAPNRTGVDGSGAAARGTAGHTTPVIGEDGENITHTQVGQRRVRYFTGQPGLMAGWVPGQDPVLYPPDTGLLFQPGDAVVFQVHYHYSTTPVPDRTSLALQTDPGTKKLKDLVIINPIAPVEIPCMPGQTAPLCNRDAAIAADAKEYGGIGSAAESGLLALCGKTPEELTAGFNGVAHSTCDYTIPMDGVIVGAMGHMHTLGSQFRFTLDPGTPQQKILLDIPLWNFGWQMNYGLQTPLHVHAGEKIRMDCSWDRSIDPNRPPKYIVFAEGTEDEMCFGTYAMIPDNSGG